MQYFPSERSIWINVIAWVVMPGAALLTLWTRAWPVVPIMAASAAFVLWIWAQTGYTITETDLEARSGPFRWRIPLASIKSVRPTRNPLSSPALSYDRLEVRHTRGSLLISPEDRERFLTELRQRCPEANI